MKSEIENLLLNKSTIVDKNNCDQISSILMNELCSKYTDEYFNILSIYIESKKNQRLTTIDVAQKSKLPELTVKRFENLKTIPKISTVIKILGAVGLKLTVSPINESAHKKLFEP